MYCNSQLGLLNGGTARAAANRWLWLRGGLLACFVAPALPITAHAQPAPMFQHHTVNQGLSQGSVVCILQDNQGFMWFGTQDGLNRFDGYEFTVFKHSPADTTSLNDTFVITIAEDSSGTLWVGTLNKPDVLNRFDRIT